MDFYTLDRVHSNQVIRRKQLPMPSGPVPDQETPRHILNALCDDTLYTTIGHLSDARDLLQAVNVCVRFKENVHKVFKRRYAAKCFELPMLHNQPMLHEAESYLCTFGSYIKWMLIDFDEYDAVLTWIVKYCENLTTFELKSSFITRNGWIELKRLIPRLQKLWLHCNPLHYDQIADANIADNQLESLEVCFMVDSFKFNCYNHFPHLVDLTLTYANIMLMDHLEDLREFLLRHQTIRRISFIGGSLTMNTIDVIAQTLPHIEKLAFHPDAVHGAELWTDWSQLKSLKELELWERGCGAWLAFLPFSSMVEHRIPSERLSLIRVVLCDVRIDLISRLVHLKHLEVLLPDGTDIDKDRLIIITENMTQLKTIRVRSYSITVTDIMELAHTLKCPSLEQIIFENDVKRQYMEDDLTMANCDTIAETWGKRIKVFLFTKLVVSGLGIMFL